MITAVVGGQFGSEGKGAVVADLALLYPIHVRVGAANAGHTFYTFGHDTLSPEPERQKHVVQQLPCAAYANPDAMCVLGPGALISSEILQDEIHRNQEWRVQWKLPPLKLAIDHRAHVIQEEHIFREQETDLAERIGSTSTIAREGIGVATAARVMREDGCVTANRISSTLESWGPGIAVENTTRLLHKLKGKVNILLEGTQGTGLSITTGFFPYCTSRNTTAAGLAADCGLGPGDVTHSIVVMRTYPIRVAGKSGPFYPDSNETSFKDIGVEPEVTTVTKLERRVATFSMMQAEEAIRLNAAQRTEVALMFADYVVPSIAGLADLSKNIAEEEGGDELQRLLNAIWEHCRVTVTMLGTGPYSMIHTLPPAAQI